MGKNFLNLIHKNIFSTFCLVALMAVIGILSLFFQSHNKKNDYKRNINNYISNTNNTASNINNTASNINNTTSNINNTASNINNTTSNINNTTSNINNTTSTSTANRKKPKLAIIIDDFGQNRNGVKEIMQINRPLTCAIMPFLQFSEDDAINAHKHGHEVIVHLPMQSQDKDIASWLGPRPVKLCQTNSEIQQIVQDSLNSISYAVGTNIHMGTKTSENERVMSCVMNTTKEKNMYFVDSKTSTRSVCGSVAKKIGIRYTERNIFLETVSDKSKKYIKQQLLSAAELTVSKGYAVVIGHVGSAGGKITAEAIKEMIPEFENRGIKMVYVSELFN